LRWIPISEILRDPTFYVPPPSRRVVSNVGSVIFIKPADADEWPGYQQWLDE
jgi:hypothetical protein